MNKVLTDITNRLAVTTVSLFLWASGVVGFFAGIADIVQYLRYRSGFPESSFTMNLLAGIAAFMMFASSLKAIINLHKKRSRNLSILLAISSAMAFVLAFLPRAAIGSAVRPDLFTYLGGLGILAVFFLYHSIPSPDTPDNTP